VGTVERLVRGSGVNATLQQREPGMGVIKSMLRRALNLILSCEGSTSGWEALTCGP
jgi:hypothetical protein